MGRKTQAPSGAPPGMWADPIRESRRDGLSATLALVSKRKIRDQLLRGLTTTFSDDNPFAVGGEEAPNTLHIEVWDWGYTRSAFGPGGTVRFTTRAHLEDATGKTVYRASLACDIRSTSRVATSRPLWLVHHDEDYIAGMPIEHVQHSFDTMARHCGGVIADKIQRHAATGPG